MASLSLDADIERRYRILRHIGSGAYGVVWCAVDLHTEATVALKKVFNAFGNEQDAQRTLREVVLLRQLQHPHVVKLLNVIKAVNDVDVYLVFELMEADLNTAVRCKLLEPAHVRYLTYQLLLAVGYLHHRRVVHRDLKPANIFLNSDSAIKLGDFGLARAMGPATRSGGEPSDDLTDYIATRWYRAPEILLKSTAYSTAVDMWAVGCIIAEILLGEPLFCGASTSQQLALLVEAIGRPTAAEVEALGVMDAASAFNAIRVGESVPLRDLLKPRCTPDAVDLVERLVAWDPARRVAAREALQHPFVAPFRDSEAERRAFATDLPPVDLGAVAQTSGRDTSEYRAALYDLIESQHPSVASGPPSLE